MGLFVLCGDVNILVDVMNIIQFFPCNKFCHQLMKMKREWICVTVGPTYFMVHCN